jgi:hypothetical protein
MKRRMLGGVVGNVEDVVGWYGVFKEVKSWLFGVGVENTFHIGLNGNYVDLDDDLLVAMNSWRGW